MKFCFVYMENVRDALPANWNQKGRPGNPPPPIPGKPFAFLPISLRIFLGIFPPENCFVRVWSMSNCLSSRFTSTTCVPEPAAILYLRLELSISGFSRSIGVIDWMIASIFLKTSVSMETPSKSDAFTPGSIPSSSVIEPMPLS